MVAIEDKLECLRLKELGKTTREIFNEYYSIKYPDSRYNTFRSSIYKWIDDLKSSNDITLKAGTYPNFSAHGATVQVNNQGEIIQAWVKQHVNNINVDEIIDAIKNYTQPVLVSPKKKSSNANMLEIPLYDMHSLSLTIKI